VADAEENKALVRRFMEVRAKADIDAIEEMMAPDFISHGLLPGQQPGREGLKRTIAEIAATFSNRRRFIEDQVAEGDKVVTRYTLRATHDRKEIMGVAPTGREVTFKAIVIHRISGGKIAEEWGAGTAGSELMGQRLEQETRERERVEQELQVARSIQQASLPKEVPTLQGWEIAPYYRPAREVGGDFYDFQLLSEDRLAVVVGDATGKGVPAALVMSTTCGMLRAVSQALDFPSPGVVLQRVNEALYPNIPPNMFVTCFYAILDPKSGSLSYANAGHNLPCCRRHEGATTELWARGMPLGLMPGMGYEEKEMVLDAGESALFYSDGLVEAHNPEGEMFGFPRLRDLLALQSTSGGAELIDFLLADLEQFSGERWEQEDDITVLTLERLAQ
jgi:serine phosphatase RsbU (regulator of sigma subunit)/predicted ester cyclase